jgi:hypothetical protein
MLNIYDRDDIIDVRDVIERVEHLEQLNQPGPVDLGEDDNEADQDALFEELADLEILLSDLRGNGEDEQWRGKWYPVALIRDSYFEDYARELAEDIGAIRSDVGWPCNCIDWEQAARELKLDYNIVKIGGVTYWYR